MTPSLEPISHVPLPSFWLPQTRFPFVNAPHASSLSRSPSLSPLLSLEGIQKRFGGVRALKGVSFDLRPGEIHALVGKNGAGKFTLIKVLSGAHRPDGGRILLEGREVNFGSPRQSQALGIGIIYQETSLYPDLSVLENLFMGRQLTRWGRIDWTRMEREARALFERLELDLPLRARLGDLGKARGQLVEIAKALLQDARILILDEPTAALSVKDADALLEHRDLRAGGAAGNAALALTALGVSHTLVASRGADVLGDWLQTHFLTAVLERSSAATSITVGLTHPDGERTFLTHLGHLAEFGLEHIQGALELAHKGDFVLLLGAFVLPHLRSHYPLLLEWLHTLGLWVALDPGWPSEGWTPKVREEVRGWLEFCDHLLINEIEALELSGEGTLEDAVHTLVSWLPEHSVLTVKRGPQGARLARRSSVQNFTAPRVEVVDTIGAGDTFDAAYLAALVRGQTLESAVSHGIAVASRAVSTYPRQYV